VSVTDAAIDVGNKVGRSFSLSSMVPALLLVAWIFVLVTATSPFGAPFDSRSLQQAVTHWSLGKGAALLVTTFVVALALHPLLFATTQLLEGYWGPSRLAVALAHRRALRYRDKAAELDILEERAAQAVDAYAESAAAASGIRPQDHAFAEFRSGWLASPGGKVAFLSEWARDSAAKAREGYPLEGNRSMPTRLGNALRRDEDKIGQQYGLSALAVAGHISLIAPGDQAAYVTDARQQLDRAVRLCSVGLFAALLTFAWLLTSGWLLTLALVPLTFAYVCYRGSVAAAQDYTYAVAVVLDLNRFALYDALHVSLPGSSGAEVEQNKLLLQLLIGRRVDVQYRHP
jgi:hypothetical protein